MLSALTTVAVAAVVALAVLALARTRAGSPREYAVLLALYERAGRVVARYDLLACVWGDGSAGMGKALDVQVAGLRRKLGDDAARPRLLHTIRGVGLMLEDAAPPPPSTPAASPPARP